jgi:DSF synthase
MDVTPLVTARTLFPAYQQLRVDYDTASRAVWCFLNPRPRPCITLQLIEDLKDFQAHLRTAVRDRSLSAEYPIEYMVGASSHPRFFSLGGDLALFRRLIVEGDKESLRAYAHECVNVLYANATNLDAPLTTIAVVHGDALGGGFEAALSCDVIIAERSARMGFPEILFNLLPGMGGYVLLQRRIDPNDAERMLLSGLSYTADELKEIGLVNIVVPDGEGQQAAREFMHKSQRQLNAIRLLANFRLRSKPISRLEMIDHANMWVEAAMKLTEAELGNMERLVAHQDSTTSGVSKPGQVVTLPVGEHVPEHQETV